MSILFQHHVIHNPEKYTFGEHLISNNFNLPESPGIRPLLDHVLPVYDLGLSTPFTLLGAFRISWHLRQVTCAFLVLSNRYTSSVCELAKFSNCAVMVRFVCLLLPRLIFSFRFPYLIQQAASGIGGEVGCGGVG